MFGFRDFIWSEGYGRSEPWLSVANASENTMTVIIKMVMDDGRVHEFTEQISPWRRRAWSLREHSRGQHFMLFVRIDQRGAASLAAWETSMKLPPYAPVPSVYDSATTLRMTAQPPQPK